jgi:hypothetical protein
MTRSAVVLAYAHWEGFVKDASQAYVRTINSRQIRTMDLKHCLQAAALTSHFKRTEGSGKLSFIGTVLSDIDRSRSAVFSVQPEKVVDTESNLSSVVFAENIARLGLVQADVYDMRAAFIDAKLVAGRNQVAHGELVTFKTEEAIARIDGVLLLLDGFANQLIDAVRDEAFMQEKVPMVATPSGSPP